MEIKVIKTGYLEENCYLVTNNKTLIIDPGDDGNIIIDYIKQNNLDIEGILITHHHFDHVGALKDILNYKKVPVYDNTNLDLKIKDFNIETILTPGHTSDSVTYYFKDYNIMFTGDFIFKDTVGRYDLDTGSLDELLLSIEKIKKYDRNIVIYPGHGDSTTLDHEINNNPFFK